MRTQAFRTIAVILSVFFASGVPVQASPIVIRDVIQVLGSYKNPADLRLRSFSQGVMVAGVKPSVIDSRITNSNSTVPDSTSQSLLIGLTSDPVAPQGRVDTISQGDVEGTICDCGDVMVAAAGGFPKWPFFFLGVIPFFFIHDCDTCDNNVCETCVTPTPTPPSSPTPTPTPTPSPVPEPASLLLFGSGLTALGAALRRRYARKRVESLFEEEF
jgi:hypothetical protein